MSGRPDLLRGHIGRAHQGLLCAQGQSDNRDRGRDRRDPDAAGGGRLRAGQLDAVAHARSVLRHYHTERLAQVCPRTPRADGRGRGGRGQGRRSRVAGRPRHRRAGRERRSRHQERSQGGLCAFKVVVQELPSGRRLSRPLLLLLLLLLLILLLQQQQLQLLILSLTEYGWAMRNTFGFPRVRRVVSNRSPESKVSYGLVNQKIITRVSGDPFFFFVVFCDLNLNNRVRYDDG